MFSINKNFTVSESYISGSEHKIIIIDNAFNDLDKIINYANNTAYFQPPGKDGTLYPGSRDEMPAPYYEAFTTLLGCVFPSSIKHQIARCWLSKITVKPDQLSPMQTMPHYDSLLNEDMAAVHYLSGNELGGTNFYRYRECENITLSQSDEPLIINMLKQHQASKSTGYIEQSNEVFEKVHSVEAKPNRIVIYSGNILHSPSVTKYVDFDKKSPNSRTSINSFFKRLN
ncbi:DUF6445 family protein [Pseudoalteromonas sp. T1lg24]|uniref:DUF6445 family protein n=1 Tax=Pseudoalteromonas sp. T1lg24 TaxID=2077099 RepID=UPI000CF68839|nr:DUF6445 family protein [Pseudoalteromonas sp. T1lg24]